VLLKSSYFALGFYKSLKAALPPGAVKLQPVEIDLADPKKGAEGAIAFVDGWPNGFVERASTSYAPAPIYVDVSVYVDPHSRDGLRPTTFADSVTPLITVRTAPAAAPATSGGLAAMSALLPYVRKVAPDARAENALGASLTDYISGDEGVPADAAMLAPTTLIKSLPITPGKFLVLQTKSIALAPDTLGDEDSPAEKPIFDEFVNVVVSAINTAPYEVATRAARIKYISFFDPDLAQRWAAGVATSPVDRERLALLRRFEQAEWRLLDAEDTQFVAAVYDGKWGAAMRAARLAEKEFVDQRAQARSRANTAAMMSMAQGMMSMRFSGTPQEMIQSELQTMNTAVDVLQTEAGTNSQLASVGREFENRMRDVNGKGQEFLITIDAGTMALNARSLAELRAKLKLRYTAMTSPKPIVAPPAVIAASPPAVVITSSAPMADPSPPTPQLPSPDAAPWPGGLTESRLAIVAQPPAPPPFVQEPSAPLATAAQPSSAPSYQFAVDPRAVELTFWQSVAMSGDAPQYQAYLNKYPVGEFSDLARAKIAALAKTPEPMRAATAPSPTRTPPPVESIVLALANTTPEVVRDSQGAAPPKPGAPTPPPPAESAPSAAAIAAPPPPRPSPHFDRPQLASIPPLDPPASFCSAEQRNAYHEEVYVKAQTAALHNTALLNAYLDQLNAMFKQQVQLPDGGNAGAIMEELKLYGARARTAFDEANRLTEMHATIMAISVTPCAMAAAY
jgi:hypothetical protein